MILDLVRLDVDTALVLLFEVFLKVFGHHFGNVVDMATAFCCSDGIDERHLLESLV